MVLRKNQTIGSRLSFLRFGAVQMPCGYARTGGLGREEGDQAPHEDHYTHCE